VAYTASLSRRMDEDPRFCCSSFRITHRRSCCNCPCCLSPLFRFRLFICWLSLASCRRGAWSAGGALEGGGSVGGAGGGAGGRAKVVAFSGGKLCCGAGGYAAAPLETLQSWPGVPP